MKSQIKKLLIFLSAVMMLTVVMCLNASAVSATCPYYADGEHWWEAIDSKTPTCEEDGYYKAVCLGCMQEKDEIKPALGGTCEWALYSDQLCRKEYFCKNCQAVKYEYIDANHDWMEVDCNGDVGTCSPDYWVAYYCSGCGKSKTVTGATTGHNFDWDPEVTDWEDPTCTTPGYERAYCDCGLYEERTIPATGEHGWEMLDDKPETCTEDGWQEFYCYYDCGAIERVVISATGHTYKNDWAEILAPSCTGQGVKIKVCNTCSFVNFETLAALGHTDNDKDSKCDVCKALLECSGSGTVAPEAPHEHTFGEWVTEGSLSFRQCECGHIEIKVVTNGGNVEIEYPDSDEGSFEVETVEGDSFVLVEEKVAAELGGGWEVLKAFDINLKNSDGVHVQPDGSVKVKLPLDWEKEGNYKVYRVNDDGSFTDMNAYQQGSHMVFDIDHFSVYIIVEEVAVEAPAEPVPEENKKETNVFDFLIEFFNNIMDFFRKLFGMK